MRFKSFFLVAVLAVSAPLLASTTLFTTYEDVRQAFLKNSLEDVQKNAAKLAADAKKANKRAVAAKAASVAKSADLDKARAAFAGLSDELVKSRANTTGAPAVYHCTMIKKQWLQPKGKVGNPYDPSMAMCGQLKAE